MPFARMSLPQSWSKEKIHSVSEGVYQAMRSTINVPEGDNFQVITQHPHSMLIADKMYLGVERSDDVVIIDIILATGRTDEQKNSCSIKSP